MRVADYVIRPDSNCWILATIRTRPLDAKNNPGEEYETDVRYPARFDLALRDLLDRMVADGLTPDSDLERAVNTVSHLYATIGRAVES